MFKLFGNFFCGHPVCMVTSILFIETSTIFAFSVAENEWHGRFLLFLQPCDVIDNCKVPMSKQFFHSDAYGCNAVVMYSKPYTYRVMFITSLR